MPYAAYTGDPVHRFFQMWQDFDGGKLDKFVWVEETIGTGSNGAPPPAGGFNPKEGAISMGFYNMNPFTDAAGKRAARRRAVLQVARRPVCDQRQLSPGDHGRHRRQLPGDRLGRRGVLHQPRQPRRHRRRALRNQIENPDPVAGTNNYYTQDGYGGGSYVNCSDPSAPGRRVGQRAAASPRRVATATARRDHYYLVNNYNMFWNQTSSNPRTLGPTSFVLPPQSIPTIADVMTAKGVSWKYYSGDRGNDPTVFAHSVDGVPLLFHFYCGICDPLTGYLSIMKNPSEEAKLQNYGAFLQRRSEQHAAGGVVRSSVRGAGRTSGGFDHDQYEKFLQALIDQVKGNPELWASTAIFITTDEGGGYYDSGYIQPVDFFGDGTRIPFIAVSPFAKKGYRRPHLLRPCLAVEVHREELGPADGLAPQPRQSAEPGRRPRRQPLRAGKSPGHRRSHEPVRLRP